MIIMVLSAFTSLPEVLKGSEAVGLTPGRMLRPLAGARLRTTEPDLDLPRHDVSIPVHPGRQPSLRSAACIRYGLVQNPDVHRNDGRRAEPCPW